jgi:hypothetical protein
LVLFFAAAREILKRDAWINLPKASGAFGFILLCFAGKYLLKCTHIKQISKYLKDKYTMYATATIGSIWA